VNLASVACGFSSLSNELKGFLGSQNIRSNAPPVSDVTCRLAIRFLGKELQLLVNFGTLAENLGER
jgi:hypothetical protein